MIETFAGGMAIVGLVIAVPGVFVMLGILMVEVFTDTDTYKSFFAACFVALGGLVLTTLGGLLHLIGLMING